MSKIAEKHARELNRQQAVLNRMMNGGADHAETMALFFQQHARLHARSMAQTEPWSLEDEVLDGLSDDAMRRIPSGGEHSIAWLLWHIARCEDITMNLLVSGGDQVLVAGGWLERLRISVRDTGNTMTMEELAGFRQAVDLQALREYRQAVGRRTREIVKPLGSADLKRKVEPAHLQRVWDEGAVLPGASGIVEYWGRRTVAGLLLMPASRHLLTHLTEAIKIGSKLKIVP